MKAENDRPDCCASARKITPGGALPAALCLLLVLAAAGPAATAESAAEESAAAESDSRQIFREGSPPWLRAVGKLLVPGSRYENGRRRHHREDCSATLVANPGRQQADTVVTAWHCLEFYRDLSKPISFTARGASGELLSREAYRLADGGGMHRDWAILRLYQPIAQTEISAMHIHPEKADPGRPITMAGYSRDDGKGEGGEQLTYHAGCRITSETRDGTDSDCRAYKGASGGAVVQLSSEGQALYSGVISRGDSERLSIYVPVAHFRSALHQYLD